MGETGIGKHLSGHRPSFILKSVNAGSHAVYTDECKKILGGHTVEDLSIDSFATMDPCSGIELNLITPLRFKHENQFFEASLPFHVLARAMLRRISSLFEYYGGGEPDFDYHGLVERAKSIDMIESSLQWFDWRRFSNRQDQSMLMGGMVGKIAYRGNLKEFLPLLRICEKVHIGKQTTFGLGKIGIAPLK
jgi:CRISPR/Cas system endoribonuclease Cas6 (RAMP superfamily)